MLVTTKSLSSFKCPICGATISNDKESISKTKKAEGRMTCPSCGGAIRIWRKSSPILSGGLNIVVFLMFLDALSRHSPLASLLLWLCWLVVTVYFVLRLVRPGFSIDADLGPQPSAAAINRQAFGPTLPERLDRLFKKK